MKFTKEELDELIKIHKKNTGELLTYEEAIEIGTRLVNLFKIISKQIPY